MDRKAFDRQLAKCKKTIFGDDDSKKIAAITKKYSNNPKKDAAEILSECVLRGKAVGWGGNFEQYEKVKAILKEYNVRYVDDFYGIWINLK